MSHEDERVSLSRSDDGSDGEQKPKLVLPPDLLKAFKLAMKGQTDLKPGVPSAIHGDDQELDPDVTNIVPRAKGYEYITASGEESDRLRLLRRTQVDEHGIAVVASVDNTTNTRLAAVQIVNGDASLVPLRLEKGQLFMDVPADKITEIGFFVGYDHSPVNAVLRAGEYPGIPLTTQQESEEGVREIMIGMRGIKENELDEKRWAEQVGITERGFDPQRMRGIFAKSHRMDPNSTNWSAQRLFAVPDEQRDLLPHFDSYYVAPQKLQVLTYSALPPRSSFAPPRDSLPPNMMGPATRDMGLGFGNEFTVRSGTSGTYASRLTAAFDIRISPKK